MVPVPQYPLYSAATSLFGGSLVPYYLEETANWGLDIQNLHQSVSEASAKGITVSFHLYLHYTSLYYAEMAETSSDNKIVKTSHCFYFRMRIFCHCSICAYLDATGSELYFIGFRLLVTSTIYQIFLFFLIFLTLVSALNN